MLLSPRPGGSSKPTVGATMYNFTISKMFKNYYSDPATAIAENLFRFLRLWLESGLQ